MVSNLPHDTPLFEMGCTHQPRNYKCGSYFHTPGYIFLRLIQMRGTMQYKKGALSLIYMYCTCCPSTKFRSLPYIPTKCSMAIELHPSSRTKIDVLILKLSVSLYMYLLSQIERKKTV
jgi:hypothetical protein